MPRPVKMAAEQVTAQIASLPEWIVANEKLHREYTFADFTHAFAFMAAVATIAEKMDHHPEWRNVYNRVTVDLSTHDAGGVTVLDLELATAMEKIAAKLR